MTFRFAPYFARVLKILNYPEIEILSGFFIFIQLFSEIDKRSVNMLIYK